MSDPELTDIDEVTSRACATSMDVAERFEKHDPSAAAAYNDFYSVAIQALNLHQKQLNDMQASRNSFLDQVSRRLETMQTLNEEVTRLEDQVAATTKSVAALKVEIQNGQDKNKLLALKLSRYSMLSDELATLTQSCEDLKGRIPGIEGQIASEKAHQAQINGEIELLRKKLAEGDEVTKRRLKKSQMKALELEAKIKKSATVVSAPEPAKETATGKPKVGPSLIIHRTQDADADEVRRLRTAMEEAIKQNAAVKAQLTNLQQDLAAMHEENTALKTLMRNIMGEAK
jgi:predicted  nucleic acid-binding Zn-ribbon protein